jgi:hypothetical protein
MAPSFLCEIRRSRSWRFNQTLKTNVPAQPLPARPNSTATLTAVVTGGADLTPPAPGSPPSGTSRRMPPARPVAPTTPKAGSMSDDPGARDELGRGATTVKVITERSRAGRCLTAVVSMPTFATLLAPVTGLAATTSDTGASCSGNCIG